MNHFDRIMFGGRSKEQGTNSVQNPENNDKNQLPENHNTETTTEPNQAIDLNSMVNNFDQIMKTANQLGPMIKQLSPLLSLFKKK